MCRAILLFFLVTLPGWTFAGLPDGAGAAESARVRLDDFGTVVWRRTVRLSAHQSACIGDRFYPPGASIEFGVLPSRYGDRAYFRTDRKILEEWPLSGPGDVSGLAERAGRFVARFAQSDTLFLELRDVGAPVFAAGEAGLRMSTLFRHWIADAFTIEDWRAAAELGIPQERFLGPAPEQICMLGSGAG